MAIITPASPILEIRGTAGGLTARPRQRRYVGAQSSGRTSRTSRGQRQARSQLAAANAAWRQLEPADVHAWATYAADLGDQLDPPGEIPASGYNLFIAQAMMRLTIGLPPVERPGLFANGYADSQALLLDTLDNGATLRGRFLRETVFDLAERYDCLVYAAPPQRQSDNAEHNRYAFIGSFEYNGFGTPIDGYPVTFDLPRPVPPGGNLRVMLRTVTSQGTYGRRITYIMRSVSPGFRLAFRLRNFLQGFIGSTVERRANDTLVITENAEDPTIQTTIDLTASNADTIGELRSRILALTDCQIIDADTSLNSRPSVEIPVFRPQSLNLALQPVIIEVPD